MTAPVSETSLSALCPPVCFIHSSSPHCLLESFYFGNDKGRLGQMYYVQGLVVTGMGFRARQIRFESLAALS